MNVATLRVIITCAGLAIITAARAIAPENNVIITKLEAAYTIEADCSSAAICVRAEEKRTYTATRANASDIWATFYNESISIDRAKAPERPRYTEHGKTTTFFTQAHAYAYCH